MLPLELFLTFKHEQMSRWKAWEHETSTLEYQIANGIYVLP